MVFTFVMDGFRLPTQINQARNWRVRAGAVKKQRTRVALEWLAIDRETRERLEPPYHVTLTRVGPQKIDSDNVAMSAKAVRDEIAKQLGENDGNENVIRFDCERERGPWAVRVRIACGALDVVWASSVQATHVVPGGGPR